MVAAIFSGE